MGARQRPANPRLNRRHPMTTGLVTYVIPGVGELVGATGVGSAPVGSPTFGSSPLGPALAVADVLSGHSFTTPEAIRSLVGRTTLTMAVWTQMSVLAGDYAEMLSVPYQPTWAVPYMHIQMGNIFPDTSCGALFWNIGTTDWEQNTGHQQQSSSGYLLADNLMHCYVMTRNTGSIGYYRDGTIWGAPVSGADTTPFSQPATLQQTMLGTHHSADPGEGKLGSYLQGMIWNRVLSDGEISQLASQPFGLLKPRLRIPFRDITAPSVPGTPTISNPTASTLDAGWTASTDNIAVTGYDVLITGPL